jgi:flagellar FliL protein
MAAKASSKEAEQDDDAPEASAAKPKRSILRLALMGAVGLGLLGGVGGGGYYYFFAGNKKKEEHAAVAAVKPPAFLDLPDVLVNLSNAGSDRTQYLKMKLVLELADASLVPQVQPMLPRVMDTFQVFLRELRPSDLDGSAGVFRLKEELTRRVNTAIAPIRINAVLFKEMVVQ